MEIHKIPKDFNIRTVMNSGQCFGIDELGGNPGTYVVRSGNTVCYITEEESEYAIRYIPGYWIYWKSFFHIDDFHYQECLNFYKKSDNVFLQDCAYYSDGMIILKQDLWETIVSFIISQRRSIPSIKSSLSRLRDNFGDICSVDHGDFCFHKFPSPEKLLTYSVEEIQEKSGIGYRAPYLHKAANWYIANKDRLKSSKSYEESLDMLEEIKGVGDKVASCICLFGLNHSDAFPVDVWIQRVLDKNLISDSDIESAPDKGFLQQIIFYYTINHKNHFK
jgi:N-glycosylase/DNA lyase